MNLNATTVANIVKDCLFKEDEDQTNKVSVDGILLSFDFHPERLESHRAEVSELLAELPEEFHAGKGGGWSTLNACNDKNGIQWGEHRDIDFLCSLAIALGLGGWCLSRDFWKLLPGQMPYFVVNAPSPENPPNGA
jgi:hypothetical protein